VDDTMKKPTKTYEFTLIVDGIADIDDATVDALYEAGCDDSSLGVRSGAFIASFDRESESFEDAVLSAIADIRKANVGATGFRLSSRDLVTLSDVARRIGKTKQAISNYAKGIRGPGGFPHAAVEAKDPLYEWSDVAAWLETYRLMPGDAAKEAESRKAVYTALEFSHMVQKHPDVARKLSKVITFPTPELEMDESSALVRKRHKVLAR
jgi:hypothetical protein